MRISDWSSDVCSSDLPFPTSKTAVPLNMRAATSTGRQPSSFPCSHPVKPSLSALICQHTCRCGCCDQHRRLIPRSTEESSVGKEGVSKCRVGGWPYHTKK